MYTAVRNVSIQLWPTTITLQAICKVGCVLLKLTATSAHDRFFRCQPLCMFGRWDSPYVMAAYVAEHSRCKGMVWASLVRKYGKEPYSLLMENK